jgi:hypothetical protein
MIWSSVFSRCGLLNVTVSPMRPNADSPSVAQSAYGTAKNTMTAGAASTNHIDQERHILVGTETRKQNGMQNSIERKQRWQQNHGAPPSHPYQLEADGR